MKTRLLFAIMVLLTSALTWAADCDTFKEKTPEYVDRTMIFDFFLCVTSFFANFAPSFLHFYY